LAKVEVKASPVWRTLEIIGGIIVIATAGIVLADPQFAVLTLVIVIAAGLVIGGLFRIGVGAFAIVLPSTLRTLNIAGGIIAVVLGIAALLDLQAATLTLITVLALAILLVGAFEVGVGIARHPPAWLRALIIAIGVLTVVLAGVVILDTSIAEGILAAILALALLFVGIRNLVHGIKGHHPVTTPMDTPVTAA
jgi:uncharacterized membrane protein HdeD (DUF308 family)